MGVAGTTNIMKVHLVGHILVSGRGLDSINATAVLLQATKNLKRVSVTAILL